MIDLAYQLLFSHMHSETSSTSLDTGMCPHGNFKTSCAQCKKENDHAELEGLHALGDAEIKTLIEQAQVDAEKEIAQNADVVDSIKPGLSRKEHYRDQKQIELLVHKLTNGTFTPDDPNDTLASLNESGIAALETFLQSKQAEYDRPLFKELLASELTSLKQSIEDAKRLKDFRRGGWEQRAAEIAAAYERRKQVREKNKLAIAQGGTPTRMVSAKSLDRDFYQLQADARRVPGIYAEIESKFPGFFDR